MHEELAQLARVQFFLTLKRSFVNGGVVYNKKPFQDRSTWRWWRGQVVSHDPADAGSIRP